MIEYIGDVQHDELLNEESKIVIFGIGKVGKLVYDYLSKIGKKEKIVAICDNKMAGNIYDGREIYSVCDATEKFFDATWIISSCCVLDMKRQLDCLGIEKIHIIRL